MSREPGVHDLNVVDAAGEPREYLLFVPHGTVRGLAVLFHPFGSNPELVLHGGTDGEYLIRPLDGAARSAQLLGLAVLAPRARGRALAGVSLAWTAHLDAAWQVAEVLRVEFALDTVGAGGLSMGGLEALVFAGQHPDGVGAVWATNPIVDLAQWWNDLPSDDGPDGLANQIAVEVGGSPVERHGEYRARSPFDYLDGLARRPVRITWSPADTVIPNQATAHAHLLAAQLGAHGGVVVEVVATHAPTDAAADAGRFAHEACDVREALGWLAELLIPEPSN